MAINQIKISVDLVEAAKGNLEFLKEVESVACYFRQPHIISNALYRYENYWLPILAKNSHRNSSGFLPPLDVHWVWHTHMLSPLHYKNDCTSLIGFVPDHSFLTKANDINKAKKKTKQMWSNAFPAVPYELDFDEVELATIFPPTKLHISLLGAADRQLEFYYNVSLPHIRRRKFLAKAVKRYEMFLSLKRLNKNEFVVPMYDVDLIWHSHQLCPLAYIKDTTQVLGEVLDHTDLITDPFPPSVVTSSIENTQKIWHEMFHTHLDVPGTGYRGVSTKGQLRQLTRGDVSEFKAKTVKVMTLEVSFIPKEERYVAIEGKMELEATLMTPLKYMYVERSSPIRFRLEKKSPGSNGVFSWSFKWKDKGSGSVLHPMVPFCVSLNSHETPEGSAVPWVGFMDLVSPSPTVLSDERGEWVISAKALYEELPAKLALLQEGSFHTWSSSPGEDNVWDHVPLPPSVQGQLKCQIADHIIGSDPDDTFSVRVIHCLDLRMSVVKVFYKDELVVVSHTIGEEQLPSLKQIGKRTFNNLTLNKQHGERAMLIKNNDGDWAIVIGSWSELKKDSSNFVKEPGNLVVHVFDLIDGTKQHLNVLYPIFKQTSKRRTMFEMGETLVSLKNDTLSMLASCKCLAEQVALSFSVFVLFSLCEPRPGDVPEVDRAASVAAAEARRQGPSIRAGRYSLIRASGYHANTPSNSYLWWQWYQQREQLANLPECCQQRSAEILHCPWLPEVSVDNIDPEKMEEVRVSVIESAKQVHENHEYDASLSTDEDSDRDTASDESDRETVDSVSNIELEERNDGPSAMCDLCLVTPL